MKKSGLAFHCHHNVLVEYVYDYDSGVEYIHESIPQEEQELRLKLFQLIPSDRIPGQDSVTWKAYVTAWKAYVTAWLACVTEQQDFRTAWEYSKTAWKANVKAGQAYVKAHKKEIEALHTELCPNCSWNGNTIFPESKKELK